MSTVFEAAQTYVMLSRVQELQQLIIIDSVNTEKIYPSSLAMDELDNMNAKVNYSKIDTVLLDLNLVSLNIRSLRKHFVDLIKEPEVVNCDVILVQQTCLEENANVINYSMNEYNCHFNSFGEGKGIALYYNEKYYHTTDITTENYQISKLRSSSFDLICVYRSSDSAKENQLYFLQDLHSLLNIKRKTFVLGDFNFDILSPGNNLIFTELNNWNFIQLVVDATHIQGGLIDHCYMSDNIDPTLVTVNQKSVYYTDHDLITLKVKHNFLNPSNASLSQID